ncbi:MAG: TauD/TfdA family dioxygenase [Pseudomonadota bacterium]
MSGHKSAAEASSLVTRSLTPTFGVELENVDLRAPMSDAHVEAIRKLWFQHGIILFRGQRMDEADLVRFSRRLGALEIHVRKEYLSPDNPEVLQISNIIEDGRAIGILSDTEVGWHYDQIYLPRPAVGSLLMAVRLPSQGGATYFADMAAAYEKLPAEIKARIDGKRAIQSYDAFNAQYSVPTDKEQKKRTPDIDQPLVRTHPYSGKKAIYACPGMTTQILGLDEAESEETLQFLFEWTVREDFVYRHDWRLGDAVLWDNATTMHRRDPFNPDQQRLMKRTTILPDAAVATPC